MKNFISDEILLKNVVLFEIIENAKQCVTSIICTEQRISVLISGRA